MNVLDLFSGIGGFSLGLERAGMRTVAFCEVNEYCRAVLRKHWPDVPCYDDVRTLTAKRLAADGIVPNVISGGFPCQDISIAWDGPGLAGSRSGLWSEYLRLISELGPDFVVVENVSALLNRGLDQVLGQLAEIGYDAEWHCIPASAIGAPHRRDRIWIIAYPMRGRQGHGEAKHKSALDKKWHASASVEGWAPVASEVIGNDTLANSDSIGRDQMEQPEPGGTPSERSVSPSLYAGITRGRQGWPTEPNVGRVAYGVPDRVDRLRSLGNAVVSQIPEIIGRAIMKSRVSI